MDPGRGPLAGRYRLEEVIGRGGMSTVYRATDSRLGRTVAVKVLLAGLADQDPTYVARFEREARAVAALASSAVVAVYDTGVDDGTQFIVMEFVRGRSLAAILRDRQPLEVEEAVRIGEQVAGALGAAHAAGIVHRDIKPANVMVTDDGTVKVLDFGVARMLDATTITQAASVLGTAAYMAPERAMGEPGDARADIYSLGCLLYAMLTGRPPFDAELAAALLHQQVNAQPRPPGELRAGISRELEALVTAMLAKSPEGRPQSALEVRDRLAALAGPRRRSRAGAAPATAATVPLAQRPAETAQTRAQTAATRVLAGPPRRSDQRRRVAAVAGIIGVLAIVAIALASGGGGSPPASSTSNHAPTRAVSTPTTTTTTQPVTASTATQQPTAPPPTPAKAPHPGPPGGPPGHGGKAGKGGKHGKGGPPAKPGH
jgi:predicted Ser/Thr protein kinase